MTETWNGKALKMLDNNPFASLLKSLVADSANDDKKPQLFYALRVDSP